ncbi:transposase [Weissella hellenica]|nr:transposase [Weissella hellenica]
MTASEYCPQCGFLLSEHFYLAGTDTASYKFSTVNGYQQILLLTKQPYQCLRCKNIFIAQSKDFMPNSTISRPLLHQIIDLVKRDISEKDIAYILHLSHSKVNRSLHHAAKAYRTNYTKPLPTVICIDEVLYAKHHYGFEMINDTTSDLIKIFPTCTSIDIRRYLSNYDLSSHQHV